ncbi:uncharacterized protein ACA1_074880 [Acanthamoeba castellanii str. Neff]|uniref:Uncharacterized protein n=1 Tax=Acanthamoeba castellanii (strain ATCC 30010 / Neff) TaxID=1257118 RepID=L8HHJ3_ACACF|nr:uncharacterized protein ACA1_074880 [Acanthamoeba castellanii str. Neff]ELR23921.1 hypothetical protein ACA1_074880 [Acanthamoeba castellanii str. Neff]
MEPAAKTHTNQARNFASKMLKSEIAQCDSQLMGDFQSILQGGCIYLPNFFCGAKDFALLQSLSRDLEKDAGEGMINWSKHLKHENPAFSPTFNDIIKKMADYFGTKEDFTMGASFGASRQLVFLHPPSGRTFDFPQVNGDIFAFNSEVNQRFQHGVPKA